MLPAHTPRSNVLPGHLPCSTPITGASTLLRMSLPPTSLPQLVPIFPSGFPEKSAPSPDFTVLTYRDQSPRFFLTAHHKLVSQICSVRQCDGWFPEVSGPPEGLSINHPIVLHPFQSIRPAFKVDSSHTVSQLYAGRDFYH
ncbi:hypothetical protein CLV48_11030 [Cecembia rubra]|uniref:Uncharacterized protein n=1 Tax=Cecembia rubra TaxID=1485585 RepID=A0A2P8DYJ4_9BACT|nr:hypothetical protein CLV48_11030 [Cecembia rubra]